MKTNPKWTTPYHSVSHLSNPGDKLTQSWWATVVDRGSFAELSQWFPGCQFSPTQKIFDSLSSAKKAGEEWVRNHA